MFQSPPSQKPPFVYSLEIPEHLPEYSSFCETFDFFVIESFYFIFLRPACIARVTGAAQAQVFLHFDELQLDPDTSIETDQMTAWLERLPLKKR